MSKLKLYIFEEQEILREAYRTAFRAESTIELVGVAEDGNLEAVLGGLATYHPDVVLVGIKSLQANIIEKLEDVRHENPQVGLVLLSAFYDIKGVKRLREFARKSSQGCAFLLKHSIDKVAQLARIVHSVSEGQVIVDSMVMEGLIESQDPSATFLKELTPRELEVLSWMSKGFRNQTIAEVLCVDPKTVERHINSIYSKLSLSSESKHARVSAVMLYLRATGQLPADDLMRE